MDVFKEEQFSSAHLGHLGLVADKIDSLKIIDLIDNRLPVSEAYGTTKLFTELSLTIGQARGLLGKSTHIDTTTLSLFGDFEQPALLNEAIENDNDNIPWPKQGYAKSGRHDLKQMVLLLATTRAANFPLWMESHSGNASDQTTMPAAAVKIKQFCRELKNAPDFIYVGDSAIYANILQHSADMFWITRAPEKIKEVRILVSIPEKELS